AGLIQVFDAYPVTYDVLKAGSVVYLIYLAWKIGTAAGIGEADEAGRPMTFLQAAIFQWVNPKAWAMALTAISAYTPNQSMGTIVLVGIIFGAINLPSVSAWTILGQQMTRFLTTHNRLRVFNWVMAALLIASLFPIIWP
ncbi:MAG: LysE family transporter, partial [Pseudomonadota bacterium]